VATIDDQLECVNALLHDPSASEVINVQDTEGMTALHWALKLQQDEITAQLISHSGIKLNIVAKDGYTPLMYAVQTGNEEIVQTLLKHSGAKSSMNATDKTGNTALHLAALLGHTNIAQFLLSASPSLLSSSNTNGETPLHLAAAENNVEVVKWLIAQGAALKALTKDGLTPYQVADPDSASGETLAEKTGETPSIAPEEEITLDEPEPEYKPKDDSKSGVRKRVRPPSSATSTKKGKNVEQGSPLVARLLLVIVVGSTLTYLLSMLF